MQLKLVSLMLKLLSRVDCGGLLTSQNLLKMRKYLCFVGKC